MISRYRHEIDNARAHIISLWLVIMLLAAFLAYAFWGWSQAPEQIDVHVPPDLSSGVTLHINEIPKPNIYTFAFYMWQQINRWPEDGDKDYPKRLFQFAAYLTPSFLATLERDMKRRGRQGELAGRVRALLETPGQSYSETRVRQVADDVWEVTIDTTVNETVHGLEVKHTRIVWPLRVVRYDVDRERNPWGLAIDGFFGKGPYKVNPDKQQEDAS